MKKIIEKIVRRRNPGFAFSPDVNGRLLWCFGWQQAIALLRGSRVWLYGRPAKGMLCGSGVRLRGVSRLRWGSYVKLGDHVLLNATGRRGMRLGNNVSIGAFSRLVVGTSLAEPGDQIWIGNNVGMGEFAYLGGGGGLTIGDDCIIGQYFSCHPENHLYDDPGKLIRLQGVVRKGIHIGRNCWIGSKVTILDGVEIGDHCVIAAGAVVTGPMPPHSLIAGVPARVVRILQSAVL